MNYNNEQNKILKLIAQCQKDFEHNLRNKKVMFIYENKDRSVEKAEMYFPLSSFYHLTGVKVQRKDNKQILNSYSFYKALEKGRLNTNQYNFIKKDSTTDLKLSVLPQLMRIDKMAKIIGEFTGYNIVLQTQKLAGNTNACMGFILNDNLGAYIPNTALKKDIRTITYLNSKIIAVLKKEHLDNLYKNIVYLKKEYDINFILKNEEIKKNIDFSNIFSLDLKIDKKIYEYLQKKEVGK